MKRGRLPLTALRSFEVAGRLKSFTQAAEELFVSQAAISRQIRELEATLGHPLFERLHRAVALTPDGEDLLKVLTESFDRIDAALSAISAREVVDGVTISVEPTFAALWMVPNLAEFRSVHPDIDVKIESDPRVIEFRANEAVLAIRQGTVRSSWPRTEARLLLETSMVPVISPHLLASGSPVRAPADLQQFDLLHEENRKYWRDWFRMAGVSDDISDRGPVLADGSHVLTAALRGHGAALSDPAFIEEEVRTGRLVQPFDIRMPFGAYYLVAQNFKALPKPAAALADWILSKFATSAS
jgi:LysR family transcriptional regulator, glycine cleavage system transcriptional activator